MHFEMLNIQRVLLLIGLIGFTDWTFADINALIDHHIKIYGPYFDRHIGPCEDTSIECDCGSESSYSIEIEVPQCRSTFWKRDCKPCRGSEAHEICPKFRNCQECEHEDQCTSCPPGMTGNWCTKKKSISSKSCGKSPGVKKPSIVNGTVSAVGQWPWHAGLAINVQDAYWILCGGALLNQNWVITAAHCVTYKDTTKLFDITKLRIYLGKHFRDDSKDDKHVQKRSVKMVVLHPDFHPQSLDSDLALIQLSQTVKFTTRVLPICLPDPSELDIDDHLWEGSIGVITGWGIEGNGLKAGSTVLKFARLPIVSKRKCEEGYTKTKSPLTVTGNMYCAGYSNGFISTCGGDSGGPMVFESGYGSHRKYFLMGLLSWGATNGCGAAHQYSGFTLISEFVDWIYDYTDN